MMSEPTAPTHVLLKQLQRADFTECNRILEILIYRFGGLFVSYASTKLKATDASTAFNDTLWKIYNYRNNYKEQRCDFTEECMCAERVAYGYLWTIHRNTVSDWQKKAYVSALLEMPDDTCSAPEDCDSSPEAYVENRIKREILLRVWDSLSESDRQVLKYRRGAGRRNLALEQARQQLKYEALERFRMALKVALAEEE
jgi:hypothetical protein